MLCVVYSRSEEYGRMRPYAMDAKTEDRSQMSEDRSQKTEVRKSVKGIRLEADGAEAGFRISVLHRLSIMI